MISVNFIIAMNHISEDLEHIMWLTALTYAYLNAASPNPMMMFDW